MTTQYNTVVTYTGNAVTTAFAIPFPYLLATDVKVEVDGVVPSFTVVGSTCTITPAPAIAAQIRIYRQTGLTGRRVDFTDGAVITEQDLDKDSIQGFYMGQEAFDQAQIVLGDVASVKVVRDQTEQYKNLAQIHANTAAGHASDALSYKNAAQAFSDNAGVQSTAANNSATAAAASATAAAGSATAAAASAAAAAAGVTIETLDLGTVQSLGTVGGSARKFGKLVTISLVVGMPAGANYSTYGACQLPVGWRPSIATSYVPAWAYLDALGTVNAPTYTPMALNLTTDGKIFVGYPPTELSVPFNTAVENTFFINFTYQIP